MASNLTNILDELENVSDGNKLTLGEALRHFEGRSLGVLLVIVAALTIIPVIGALPGLPAIAAIVIIALAGQSLFSGKTAIWLPDRIAKLSAEKEKVKSAVEKVKPWASRIDALINPRLGFLVNRYVVALSAMVLALMFFPLGFIPWAVSVPAAAIVFLGLALLGKDGAAAAIGYVFAVISLWMLWDLAPRATSVVAGTLS